MKDLKKRIAALEAQIQEQPKQLQVKTIVVDNPDVGLIIEHYNNLVMFVNETIMPVLRVLALEQIQSCEQVAQDPT